MKPSVRFELDDVGREVEIPFWPYWDSRLRFVRRRVVMVIKAPRGTLTLFKPMLNPPKQSINQGDLVRAFMEAHRND